MNKEKILTIVGILVLCIALVGGTFAYFSAQGGNSTTRDVSVTSNTTDNLAFSISNDISFTVTQADLAEGGNNKSGTATATAVLTPNNKTGAASMDYYMYLDLTENEIGYSSTNTNEDAELMLQVFNSNNQLVSLTGLGSQVTSHNGVTGYDITGVTGLIPLLDPETITASNNTEATETWTIIITMINLDVNQNDNTDKVVEGNIIMQKESAIPKYATFISGPDFNDKLDEMIGHNERDAYVQYFVRSLTIDNQYIDDDYVVSEVSTQTGHEYPIYLWYDEEAYTIYYYTEAEVINTNVDMSYMFSFMSSLKVLDLRGINTSGVTNMSGLFYSTGYNTGILQILTDEGFDTSSVEDMSSMFYSVYYYAPENASIDLSWLDTRSVTNMDHMLSQWCGFATNPISLTLGDNFDTSNVTSMEDFLQGYFSYLNLGNKFDTSNVENMNYAFVIKAETNSNIVLDFSHGDFDNVTNNYRVFNITNPEYVTIYVKDATAQSWVINNDVSDPPALSSTNVIIGSPS